MIFRLSQKRPGLNQVIKLKNQSVNKYQQTIARVLLSENANHFRWGLEFNFSESKIVPVLTGHYHRSGGNLFPVPGHKLKSLIQVL